jgi:hypothetical protein
LNLFSGNAAPLAGNEYRVHSSVPPSVFCAFVGWIESRERKVTAATLGPLTELIDEFGFSCLSAACRTFSELETTLFYVNAQGSVGFGFGFDRASPGRADETRAGDRGGSVTDFIDSLASFRRSDCCCVVWKFP